MRERVWWNGAKQVAVRTQVLNSFRMDADDRKYATEFTNCDSRF
jgi:hypothetical protein